MNTWGNKCFWGFFFYISFSPPPTRKVFTWIYITYQCQFRGLLCIKAKLQPEKKKVTFSHHKVKKITRYSFNQKKRKENKEKKQHLSHHRVRVWFHSGNNKFSSRRNQQYVKKCMFLTHTHIRMYPHKLRNTKEEWWIWKKLWQFESYLFLKERKKKKTLFG